MIIISIRRVLIYIHNHRVLYWGSMLKFLEKSESLESKRSPIKYLPERTFGNSFESPSQFQMKFTVINDKTYLNPFLKYDNHGEFFSSGRQSRSVDTRWTHKINLLNIESSKLQRSEASIAGAFRKDSAYQARYNQEISADPLRFRISKGEFSEYINKNSHYRSIGPLQGVQRSDQRIEVTKSSIRKKQASKIDELTTSNKFRGDLYNTIKSNLIKNSSLLTQRNRIKRNREFIHSNFKKQLERRKKDTNYSFNLPQVDSNLQNLKNSFNTSKSAFHRRFKTQITQT